LGRFQVVGKGRGEQAPQIRASKGSASTVARGQVTFKMLRIFGIFPSEYPSQSSEANACFKKSAEACGIHSL
jgi:hypothetical protein